MISSSKLELLDQCEGAFTLPWRDEPNEYSAAGVDRHADDETAINAGEAPEEYLERWPGLTWRAEVANVYDVSSDTARHVGCGIGRNYGKTSPFEIPGTIDAEGRGNGMLVVIDRKGFERQAPATVHRQVRFLALGAARIQPAERVIVAIRPEIGPMDVAEIDPEFDLDVIALDTKQQLIRAAQVRSEARHGKLVAFHTGRQCRWCPAYHACPEQAKLRALVVRDEDDPELALSTFVDDESAAEVYELWKRLGILHKRIGEQIYRHAAKRPIRLVSGKAFGLVDKLGNEKLDGDAVWRAVRELHPGLEDQAVVRHATKKQLEATLKGKRGAMAKVLELVRAHGGATRKDGTEFTEYEPGPALVLADK